MTWSYFYFLKIALAAQWSWLSGDLFYTKHHTIWWEGRQSHPLPSRSIWFSEAERKQTITRVIIYFKGKVVEDCNIELLHGLRKAFLFRVIFVFCFMQTRKLLLTQTHVHVSYPSFLLGDRHGILSWPSHTWGRSSLRISKCRRDCLNQGTKVIQRNAFKSLPPPTIHTRRDGQVCEQEWPCSPE